LYDEIVDFLLRKEVPQRLKGPQNATARDSFRKSCKKYHVKEALRSTAQVHILFKKIVLRKKGIHGGTKILIVPRRMQMNAIFERCHEGHLGRDGTFEKVRENYTWPGMHDDLSDWLVCCDICRKKTESKVIF
jgi:hypothetical protein